MVHGKVGKHLAVERDVGICDFAHELRIGESVLTGSCIDTLYPQAPEVPFLGLAVAVSVLQALLVRVLGYGENIAPCAPITAGAPE